MPSTENNSKSIDRLAMTPSKVSLPQWNRTFGGAGFWVPLGFRNRSTIAVRSRTLRAAPVLPSSAVSNTSSKLNSLELFPRTCRVCFPSDRPPSI